MSHARSLHCGRLFDGHALRHNVRLHFSQGRVTALEVGVGTLDAEPRVAEPWLVSPGLIDIQVNGGGGRMFNDAPSAEGATQIALAHARQGSTGVLLTLITDTREQITRAQKGIHEALSHQAPGVLGLHLEGPFLNRTRKGIHRAEHVTTLKEQDVEDMIREARGVPTLITVAPECMAPQLLDRLSRAGFRVFAGHTTATASELRAAMRDGGLVGVTHLFNAMSSFGPRDAGVAGTALLSQELWVGLILDGHHIDRDAFELLWRLRGATRLVLVSDAMATAGTDQDHFVLQGQPITVRAGRCENADGTLAGASICLADGVRTAIQTYRMPLLDALRAATAAPSELLGISHDRGHLAPGARADLAVFDGQMRVRGVMLEGRWLREPAAADAEVHHA